MIITIDRQCGCGGHRVGVLLAENWDWSFMTKRSFWKNQKNR